MLRFIIKRILWMIPVMLGVLIIVFSITYLTPGDPIKTMLGSGYTPERYAMKQAEYGLDKGYLAQLGSYIWNLVTKLDMGKSFSSNIRVSKEISERIGTTLQIGVYSVLVMVIIGVPLGIISATKQYSLIDTGLTSFALIISAIPCFVLAPLCLVLFGVKLKWLPISGISSFKSWILPIGTNALSGIALIMRMTRTSMLEVIRQDYIRTARAKGLKERVIIRKHALKNALIPVVTVTGQVMAMLMSGAVIIETIFSIPGIGMYMLGGITGRDYPVINGSVILVSFIVCAMNLIVDLLYAVIDPRIKAEYVAKDKKRKLQKMIRKEEKAGV